MGRNSKSLPRACRRERYSAAALQAFTCSPPPKCGITSSAIFVYCSIIIDSGVHIGIDKYTYSRPGNCSSNPFKRLISSSDVPTNQTPFGVSLHRRDPLGVPVAPLRDRRQLFVRQSR